MATRTTIANGNWSAAGTWDTGVPANADVCIINHAVTYDANDDVTALGNITINTAGQVNFLADGNWHYMKANGNIYVNGGALRLTQKTFLRVLPTFGLVINTAATTVFTAIGSVPNTQTSLASNCAIGDCTLNVVSGIGFAPGDPINVYNYDNLSSYTYRGFEGLNIHAVDGNTVFVRRRVGPTFELTSAVAIGENTFYATGSELRSWRTGQKFVIGTEALTIEVIDATNGIIYTTTNAASTHAIGDTAYLSGVEKTHSTGEYVYRLCGTLTSNIVATNTTFDVSSAHGWAADDEVGIAGCAYANVEQRIIQSISTGGGINGSDRVTVSAAFTKNHTFGGLVVKLNRDCIFQGTSSNTTVTNAGYVYALASSGARTCVIENCEFRYVGSTDSTYYWGVMIRKSGTTSNTYVLNCSSRNSYLSGSLGAIGAYDGYMYWSLVNAVFCNTSRGATNQSNYYAAVMNCIAIGVNSIPIYSYGLYGSECSYNYAHAGGIWGLYLTGSGQGAMAVSSMAPTAIISYNDIDSCAYSLFMASSFDSGISTNNNKFTNTIGRFRWNSYQNESGNVVLSSYIDDVSLAKTTSESDGWWPTDGANPLPNITVFPNINNIPGYDMIRFRYGRAVRDINHPSIVFRGGTAWQFTAANNTSAECIGFFAPGMLCQGDTLKMSAWVRKNSTLTGTRPGIYFVSLSNTVLASTQMTTANDTWELLTLSYTATDDVRLVARISAYSSVGNFWIADPSIDYPMTSFFFLGILNRYWRLTTDSSNAGIRLSGGRLSG